ncbi:MAG TPA: SLBB domain-containing protein [Chloroflexota bacterium]|jgi:NADH-quinone oxidoreductase subunit F|nr:SLBB domain-containing protein [Chloroflexota bacterium]
MARRARPTGWIVRPGVYEVALGKPIRAIVDECGGGIRQGQALESNLTRRCVDGMDASQFDVPFDYADLQAAGSSVGCATLRVVPEGACMVEEVLRYAPFLLVSRAGNADRVFRARARSPVCVRRCVWARGIAGR